MAKPHPATPPCRSQILRFRAPSLAPPRQLPSSSWLPPSSSCCRLRTCRGERSRSELAMLSLAAIHAASATVRGGVRGGGGEVTGRCGGGRCGVEMGGVGWWPSLLLGLLVLVHPSPATGAEAVLAASVCLDEDLISRLDVDEEAVLALVRVGVRSVWILG